MRPFGASQRATMLAAELPPWAGLGACAEAKPNQTWNPDHFTDDVRHHSDPDAYVWPSTAEDAMKMCMTCPVRSECLRYAFAEERRYEQAYWAAELEEVQDGLRSGIYGGVPGPIREHYAGAADPIAECEAWVERRTGHLERKGKMTA